MRILIILCGFVALTFAEIASSNKHHSQHEQSVNAAKQSLQERLSLIEGQSGYNTNQRYGNAYGTSGSQKYVVGCSSCHSGSENRESHSSRLSSASEMRSSSSNHGVSDSDYHGVGIVGHSNHDDDDDVQSVMGPSYSGNVETSRYSSSKAFEADEMQQRVVPADLSSVSSSAYRSSVADEDDSQRTVGSGYGGSGSRIYSQSQTRGVGASEGTRIGYVAPVYVSGSHRGLSSSQYDSEHSERKPISSTVYRSSTTDIDDDDSQRTVGSGYGGSGSRIYSQSQTRGGSASEATRTGYVAPVYVSGSHRGSSSSQYDTEHSERKPISTGQYVSISARPGSSNVIAVPVRVIHAQGVPEEKVYSRTSEHSSGSESSSSTRTQNPSSTTYRVTYNPTRNYVSSDKVASSTFDSESSRNTGVQQPEKFVNYNTFNPQESTSQSRFRADEIDSHSEQSQVRVAPVSVSYPHNGGSSRYASSGASSAQIGNTQSRVPVFPVNTAESSSSSRTAEEREQRRYTPASPTYISASRIASADQEESRNQHSSSQYGGSNTYVVPVLSQTNQQSSSASTASGSQSQFQRQGGYAGSFSPYVPNRSQSAQTASQLASSGHVSQRFGTGVTSARTDDLQTYMSESERLARLQQQQIAGSSSSSALSSSDANRRTLNTASNLDSAAANFVRSSNLASRTSDVDSSNVEGAGAGGFNRVRSWNKQSKWSSGSEYGTDGKPKSYSTLSTAEAEKYNINGNEAGYKAATTTLENDGKVSTYSIHTP